MPAKTAKVDAYVASFRVTIPLVPGGYDAAKRAIATLKVENGTILILSEGLQRVLAKEVGK